MVHVGSFIPLHTGQITHILRLLKEQRECSVDLSVKGMRVDFAFYWHLLEAQYQFYKAKSSDAITQRKAWAKIFTHCTKYADIRRRIYQRRVKKQHLRIYYSHLYHTVFPCNHLISTAGLSFLPHITSIPLLFGFVFVQPPLNPPLF